MVGFHNGIAKGEETSPMPNVRDFKFFSISGLKLFHNCVLRQKKLFNIFSLKKVIPGESNKGSLFNGA